MRYVDIFFIMDNEETNFRDRSMKELDYDSNIYDYEGTMTLASNLSPTRTRLKHSISVHLWLVLSRLYPVDLSSHLDYNTIKGGGFGLTHLQRISQTADTYEPSKPLIG